MGKPCWYWSPSFNSPRPQQSLVVYFVYEEEEKMEYQREKTKKEKRGRKITFLKGNKFYFETSAEHLWIFWCPPAKHEKEGSLKKRMKMIKPVDKRTAAFIRYVWGFNGHESFHKMKRKKENKRFSSKSTFKIFFQIKAGTPSYFSECVYAKAKGTGFNLIAPFCLPVYLPEKSPNFKELP